jgi:hypothetical protein
MGSKALVEALRDVIRDFNQNLTEQIGENFKELTRQDFIKAGFSGRDLQHFENLNELCHLLGKDTLKWLSKNAVKANERWTRATVRKLLRNLECAPEGGHESCC